MIPSPRPLCASMLFCFDCCQVIAMYYTLDVWIWVKTRGSQSDMRQWQSAVCSSLASTLWIANMGWHYVKYFSRYFYAFCLEVFFVFTWTDTYFSSTARLIQCIRQDHRMVLPSVDKRQYHCYFLVLNVGCVEKGAWVYELIHVPQDGVQWWAVLDTVM